MKRLFTLVLLSSMIAMAACSEKKAEGTGVDTAAAMVDTAAAKVDTAAADTAAADTTKK